ncbi:MAG: multiple sugar transport system substrate-binding protein, partial [Cellvibrionaceae bacterium]
DAEINGAWPPAVIYTPGSGVIEAAMAEEEMMEDGTCAVAADGDYAGLSAEGTSIEWWVNHSGSRLDLLNEILADFNATNACGIEVVANNIGGYGDISKAFNGSVAAGEVTAGLIVGYPNDQSGYQLNNALVDINLLMGDAGVGLSDDEIGQYYQSFFNQSVHPLFDNQRLGFAPNRSIEMLHYNATYLEELGFAGPPTTPEEFVEMACAAADASESGVGGFVNRTDASAVAAWTFAYGGNVLTDDGTTYAYNTQATVDALSMLQELATEGEDGKVCAYFVDGFPNPEIASRNALFTMGSSSGIPFYQGDMDTFNEETGRTDVYAVAAIPHTTADPVMNIYGGDVMIPVSSREQELAAWEFVKWFTSPEPQARWVEISGYFPTNSGTVEFIGDYVAENAVFGTAIDLLQYGKFEPQLPSYFPVRGKAEDAFNAILQGEDVQETLDALTEEANELEEEILAEING